MFGKTQCITGQHKLHRDGSGLLNPANNLGFSGESKCIVHFSTFLNEVYLISFCLFLLSAAIDPLVTVRFRCLCSWEVASVCFSLGRTPGACIFATHLSRDGEVTYNLLGHMVSLPFLEVVSGTKVTFGGPFITLLITFSAITSHL